tara:strand:- start:394 stop:588 length:195 start_codon:yes stop_codon:yes gene_type:complete
MMMDRLDRRPEILDLLQIDPHLGSFLCLVSSPTATIGKLISILFSGLAGDFSVFDAMPKSQLGP